MSKIVIFRFEKTGGPGYFSRFLDRRGIPYQVLRVDENETIPSSIDGVSGLVFMGGGMSVNDELDWIPPILQLIRHAQDHGIPMLGHCLGGQLISKALGGTVQSNPVAEIGWLPVEVINKGAAPPWCADLPSSPQLFHWHYETFSLPRGAAHIFASEACPNQGFQLGRTLALQFHAEILPEMVTDWSARYIREDDVPGASIQSREAMNENLAQRARASTAVAERIYTHWIDPHIAPG